MAFKMRGWKPFDKLRKNIKTARAKRLIRKHVEGVVSPEFGGTKFFGDSEKDMKAEEKMIKAARLLEEAGYDPTFARETATGSEGIEPALEFAQSKRNKRKKKKIEKKIKNK